MFDYHSHLDDPTTVFISFDR